jgi:outer membrane scaffolding protein for murein synthesis (MipA/OmpV family)
MSLRLAACLALSAAAAGAAGAQTASGPSVDDAPDTVRTSNPDPVVLSPEPQQQEAQRPVGDPVRPTATKAPDEPLWELRLGGTGLYASAYPGSSEMKTNGVVAPLFIYRGDRIRFGEFGVARAIAAETQKLQLDVSLDAAYSAKNPKARAGMPDIDYLFQVGPQLVYRFFDTGWTTDGRTEVTGFLPVRGVAASDFSSIHHVGLLAEPSIMYRRQLPGDLRTSLNAQFVVSIADEGVMDYWYQVDPQYATPARPAYDGKGGYLSSAIRLWWTHEFSKDFELYLTYHGRYFGGSANDKSPLLEEKFTHAVSVSFVWKMLKSKARAKNGDM